MGAAKGSEGLFVLAKLLWLCLLAGEQLYSGLLVMMRAAHDQCGCCGVFTCCVRRGNSDEVHH